jgi:folate-dependent phosphoribosylglycinamide formyltransferase PurN
MRVVVLCSSPYSETGCATAARLAQLGYAPVGAITLPSWERRTILRKLGQWGPGESARYAWAKLSPRGSAREDQVRNPYLKTALQWNQAFFRNLHEVAGACGFPVLTVADQNSAESIARVRSWSPDIAIFTGGNILRKPLLEASRLGVLNAHLALLPEIRGMSSPEWSLLRGVPLGITIHFVDTGIDTGPVLLRRAFPVPGECDSLTDLRNRMIAAGIEMIGEVVAGLEAGTLSPAAQPQRERDNQFFVMHERLRSQAAHLLKQRRPLPVARVDE